MLPLSSILIILIAAVTIVGVFPLAADATDNVDGQRDKRGIIDFGSFLRNVLLKSAMLSSGKANLTHAIDIFNVSKHSTTTTIPLPMPLRSLRAGDSQNYYYPNTRVLEFYADYVDKTEFMKTISTTTVRPKYFRGYKLSLPPSKLPIPMRKTISKVHFSYSKEPSQAYDKHVQVSYQRQLPVTRSPKQASQKGQRLLSDNLIYQYAQTDGKICKLLTNCREIGFSQTFCRYLL